MTPRPAAQLAPAHETTQSVEERLRAIASQLALVSDVLRLHARIEADEGLRPEAMHALSSVCDVAHGDLTTLRRGLPVAILNTRAR